VNKNISDLYPSYEDATDIRFMGPVHACLCGSNLWNVKTMFEDYEISAYFTDMECAVCGTKAKAPTPLDRPQEP
jgi:hypothetical protein